MFGSRSFFFYSSKEDLNRAKIAVAKILEIKGYSEQETAVYIKAFDFFCENPAEFDGATVVKDLADIPGLDLDAMLHDYHYLVYSAGTHPTIKWKADWILAKGGERKGKGSYSSFSKFVALTITSIVFIPYSLLKRGFISKEQKNFLIADYKTLIK